MTAEEEIRDLDERIRLLREASRPSEPLEDAQREPALDFRNQPYASTRRMPSAQGHILSALSQLERRRAALLGR